MSGSRTITEDEDRLDNVHPGSILREDFLIGSEIPVIEVADGAGIPLETIDALLAEERPIDADVDLERDDIVLTRMGIPKGDWM